MPRKKPQKSAEKAPAEPQENNSNSTSAPNWRMPAFVMFVLGVLLYANTFSHQYALDDHIVIKDNQFTQQGFAGIGDLMTNDAFTGFFKMKKDLVEGGRYRPLSMVTFAIELELFGEAPGISHVINALIYGLCGLLLYLVLQSLLPPADPKKWWTSIAFLVTLIFVVHPVHTEVVANIKGRDELMALVFSLLTFRAALKFIDTEKKLQLVWVAVFFFLGMLSKESTFPFIAIIPLGIWYFRKASLARISMATAPMLGIFLIYMVLRSMYAPAPTGEIPAEILNNPFIGVSFADRAATVFVTLGKYIYLQIIPHPLTHDYYPFQVPITTWADPKAILAAIAYIGMGIWAVMKLPKKHPLSFALLFYFASLSIVSNLFFTVGTLMGERFVFIPSIGFILAFVLLLKGVGKLLEEKGIGKNGLVATGLLGVMALVYAGATVARNPVWENNETLFLTDVETSPNSAKLRTAAGGLLVDRAENEFSPKKEATLQEAKKHLEEAVKLYPQHSTAWMLKGRAEFNLKNYPAAVQAYTRVTEIRPNFLDGWKNLAISYGKANQFAESANTWKKAAKQFGPSDGKNWFEAGSAYSKGNMPDSALKYFDRAINLSPNYPESYVLKGMVLARYYQQFDQAILNIQQGINLGSTDPGAYDNLGITYAAMGQPQMAIQTFEKGIEIYPNAANLYLNLGVTYRNLGDMDAANRNFQKAQQLNPNLQTGG